MAEASNPDEIPAVMARSGADAARYEEGNMELGDGGNPEMNASRGSTISMPNQNIASSVEIDEDHNKNKENGEDEDDYDDRYFD